MEEQKKRSIRAKADRSYDALQFRDDFLFCKILENHPDIAKELIELILGLKISRVEVQKQDPIEITPDGRGIRLDVYAEDRENTVYDIEMQTTAQKDLPKRTRYYQGMIDLDQIERGARFSELKKTYIIFICMGDPFDRKRYMYAFSNLCQEDRTLQLQDEAAKVFLNADGENGEISEGLKDFFQLLKNGTGSTKLAVKISALVEKARENKEWRQEFMTLYMRDMAKKEEGREEGLKEGREEGRKEMVISLIRKGMLSLKQGAECLQISEEELKRQVDEEMLRTE